VFAESLKKLGIVVTALVNNAAVTGAYGNKETVTEDGFDLLFKTNVLGTFYLTQLILPLMEPTGTVLFIGSNYTKPVNK